jgi:hypothetical protein
MSTPTLTKKRLAAAAVGAATVAVVTHLSLIPTTPPAKHFRGIRWSYPSNLLARTAFDVEISTNLTHWQHFASVTNVTQLRFNADRPTAFFRVAARWK